MALVTAAAAHASGGRRARGVLLVDVHAGQIRIPARPRRARQVVLIRCVIALSWNTRSAIDRVNKRSRLVTQSPGSESNLKWPHLFLIILFE